MMAPSVGFIVLFLCVSEASTETTIPLVMTDTITVSTRNQTTPFPVSSIPFSESSSVDSTSEDNSTFSKTATNSTRLSDPNTMGTTRYPGSADAANSMAPVAEVLDSQKTTVTTPRVDSSVLLEQEDSSLTSTLDETTSPVPESTVLPTNFQSFDWPFPERYTSPVSSAPVAIETTSMSSASATSAAELASRVSLAVTAEATTSSDVTVMPKFTTTNSVASEANGQAEDPPKDTNLPLGDNNTSLDMSTIYTTDSNFSNAVNTSVIDDFTQVSSESSTGRSDSVETTTTYSDSSTLDSMSTKTAVYNSAIITDGTTRADSFTQRQVSPDRNTDSADSTTPFSYSKTAESLSTQIPVYNYTITDDATTVDTLTQSQVISEAAAGDDSVSREFSSNQTLVSLIDDTTRSDRQFSTPSTEARSDTEETLNSLPSQVISTSKTSSAETSSSFDGSSAMGTLSTQTLDVNNNFFSDVTTADNFTHNETPSSSDYSNTLGILSTQTLDVNNTFLSDTTTADNFTHNETSSSSDYSNTLGILSTQTLDVNNTFLSDTTTADSSIYNQVSSTGKITSTVSSFSFNVSSALDSLANSNDTTIDDAATTNSFTQSPTSVTESIVNASTALHSVAADDAYTIEAVSRKQYTTPSANASTTLADAPIYSIEQTPPLTESRPEVEITTEIISTTGSQKPSDSVKTLQTLLAMLLTDLTTIANFTPQIKSSLSPTTIEKGKTSTVSQDFITTDTSVAINQGSLITDSSFTGEDEDNLQATTDSISTTTQQTSEDLSTSAKVTATTSSSASSGMSTIAQTTSASPTWQQAMATPQIPETLSSATEIPATPSTAPQESPASQATMLSSTSLQGTSTEISATSSTAPQESPASQTTVASSTSLHGTSTATQQQEISTSNTTSGRAPTSTTTSASETSSTTVTPSNFLPAEIQSVKATSTSATSATRTPTNVLAGNAISTEVSTTAKTIPSASREPRYFVFIIGPYLPSNRYLQPAASQSDVTLAREMTMVRRFPGGRRLPPALNKLLEVARLNVEAQRKQNPNEVTVTDDRGSQGSQWKGESQSEQSPENKGTGRSSPATNGSNADNSHASTVAPPSEQVKKFTPQAQQPPNTDFRVDFRKLPTDPIKRAEVLKAMFLRRFQRPGGATTLQPPIYVPMTTTTTTTTTTITTPTTTTTTTTTPTTTTPTTTTTTITTTTTTSPTTTRFREPILNEKVLRSGQTPLDFRRQFYFNNYGESNPWASRTDSLLSRYMQLLQTMRDLRQSFLRSGLI